MLLNSGVGEESWEFLGLQGDQPVHPKGNQSWIFIGRTDAEAEILWPPDVKSWLIWKDPGAGKDWGQEEGMTEDEMIGCYHNVKDMSLSRLRWLVMDREAWCAAIHGIAKGSTRLSDWTELIKVYCYTDQNGYNKATKCYKWKNETFWEINL